MSGTVLDKSTNVKDRSVLSIATLGSYKVRISQLETVNEILWKNAVAFNAREYQQRWNDYSTLEAILNSYLSIAEGITIPRSDANQKEISSPEDEYFESLKELRTMADRLKSTEGSERSEVDVSELGISWALTGYIQVCIFCSLGYIDPVHKVGLKLKYVREDIIDCKKTLYVAELHSKLNGDYVGSENTHPIVRETLNCLENLVAQEAELKTSNAVRPKSCEFVALVREIADFRKSLGSHATLRKHLERLVNVVKNIEENRSPAAAKLELQRVNKEVGMWEDSVKRFSDNLESRFISGYPDIVLPLLSAVAQMKHGINILAENTKRIANVAEIGFTENAIESFMTNLVRFPSIGEGQEDLLALVDLLPCEKARIIISRNIETTSNFVVKQEVFRMMKCSLSEFYNHVIVTGNLSSSLWSRFNSLLRQVVLTWQQQRKEREEKEAEKESLYKNKAIAKGGSLTEDEEITLELRQLFPKHHETDFADVEGGSKASLERNSYQTNGENGADEEDAYSGLITEEDIENIYRLHAAVVQSFTSCQWLRSQPNKRKVDYVIPLLQRYKTFGLLLSSVRSSLGNSLTKKLYTSLNFLVTVTLAFSQGGDSDFENGAFCDTGNSECYDFYKDSNVEEVRQCLPVLERIVDRVKSLLNEWPEHPSLKSIDGIAQRIYSFPVTSSVSRFLTGIELLLVKMQEWEENAHSGVSLSEYSLLLTQQIISWRRLELSCWKDCLNVAQRRLKSRASKWWFYIFALVEGYLGESLDIAEKGVESKKGEEVTRENFVESLHLFMNTSTLGEYSARLDLLFTFHCHVCNLETSESRDELLSILWNTHKYYAQFADVVNAKISSLKSPIEKKLKDFVKIARWNDISYWAVKETVEKTHRTLHKFIREFETKLKDTVTLCLVTKVSDYKAETNPGVWDAPANDAHVINPKDYTAKSIIEVEENPHESLPQGALLSKAETLLTRAKKLCTETILMSSYPAMRMGIEQFMQEALDHSSHLKNLDIDRTLPKPKQKSQAKSILQQKRMALATYFKALTLVGVSYRTGVLTWANNQEKVLDLSIPPLNLHAAFELTKLTKTDKEMLKMWEGCDKYYYKSLVKLDAVNGALTTNKTDLGLQNMERCRGFSTHIMLLAHEQKRTFTESFNYFLALRLQLQNLSGIEKDHLNIPKQSEIARCADDLKQLLTILTTSLEQVKLYLKTCPNEREFGSEKILNEVFRLDSSSIPIVDGTKASVSWEKANSVITQCLQDVFNLKKKFDTIFPNAEINFSSNRGQRERISIKTWTHYSFLKESCEAVEKLRVYVKDFKEQFSTVREQNGHPILETISWLEEKIIYNVDQFKQLENLTHQKLFSNDPENRETIDNCAADVERLINTVLIAIQKQYKKNLTSNEETPDVEDVEGAQEEYEESTLEEKQLTEKLIRPLSTDIKELSLEDVFQQINDISKLIYNTDATAAIVCNR